MSRFKNYVSKFHKSTFASLSQSGCVFDMLPDTSESEEIDEACDKLTEYYSPMKNIEYDIDGILQTNEVNYQ